MNRHLHNGHGADNEEPTDISLPHLRRSAQLLLSSRRVLLRYQPYRHAKGVLLARRSKISAPTKDLHGRGESRDSHGRDRADAHCPAGYVYMPERGHGLETACGIVFCRFGAYLFLKLAYLFRQRGDLANIDRSNIRHHLWQTILRIFQNFLQTFDICRSLWRNTAELGEMSPSRPRRAFSTTR